ncbi:MAG: molybdopterin-binding protein, partial [Thermoplasmata archaeon]|nr:molybdopterin-binding protein [Thermoplasmata archaeon]
MSAVVLAVGSELLGPGRRDTNGKWLIGRLLDLGIDVSWRAAVDDDAVRIARLIRAAWEDSAVVLLTGGIGPTEDDRTREAVARAVDAPLVRDPVMTHWITSLFAARGRVAGRSNRNVLLHGDDGRGRRPLGSLQGSVHTRG